jgi:hypothetical protein
MFNKSRIIQSLKALKLPRDQYCVMTGAALVLQDVKEYTQDIDIGCSDELYYKLRQQGYILKQYKDYEGIIIDEGIEMYRNWHAEKKVYIEEIPVADILSVRSYKQKLGREKDLLDIILIDKFLAAKEKTELDSCL